VRSPFDKATLARRFTGSRRTPSGSANATSWPSRLQRHGFGGLLAVARIDRFDDVLRRQFSDLLAYCLATRRDAGRLT
jgi:hypothetical protein